MDWVGRRGGRGGKRQRRGKEEEEEGGDDLDSYCSWGIDQMGYQPSSIPLQRQLDAPHRPKVAPPGKQPRDLNRHGHQIASLQPPRTSSLDWQEERRLSPQRKLSPDRQEDRPLADSDTLPAPWRDVQPAKKETRDTVQGQPTSKAHSQRPAERRQRTSEDDDGAKELGSSPSSSLGGSMLMVEKDECKPDDHRYQVWSDWFGLSEHEAYGSGDEDIYVHVSPRSSPRHSYRGGRP